MLHEEGWGTKEWMNVFVFELGGGGEWGMIRMNGAQRNGVKQMEHEGNNEVVEEEKMRELKR